MTLHPMRRTLYAGLVLACLVLGLSTIASAQEKAGAKSPQPEEKPVIQPIPSSQISVKANETESVLRSMRNGSQPQPDIVKIGEQIAEALGDLEALLARTRSLLGSAVSIRDFEDLQRHWSRERQRVDEWQSRVQGRAELLDRDLDRLQRARRTWQATLETEDEAGAQQALVEVINASLAAVRDVEQSYGARRAELLTIEEQLGHADEIIDQALGSIDKIVKDPSRFVGSASEPLWILLTHLPPRADHLGNMRQAYEKGRRDMSLFVRSYKEELVRHALFSVALLILLIVLNRRAMRLEADTPEIEAAKHTLSRPIAAAVVVSVALGSLYYPDAPQLIDDLAVVILIPPIFLLLPKDAGRMRTPLIVLVIVSVLSRFIDMLAYLSPLQRVSSLLVSGGTGAYLAWILRKRAVPDSLRAHFLSRLLRAAAVVAAALLGVAVVANIVGYFSLASILTSGVLIASYVGVVYFLIYFVIAAILWIGLSSATARRLRTIERHGPLIRDRLLSVAKVLLTLIWIAVALDFLEILPFVRGWAMKILTAQLRFGEVSLSLLTLGTFTITIWAAFAISRFIRFVLGEDVYPRLWLPRGVANAISTSIHYVALLLGFFLAFAATGADLNKFAVLAGAFGVGLGFGLQNVVANFVAGLILIFERPIMTGDMVEIGAVTGVVKQIGLRSTTVRTLEGAEVIVPNGKLVAEEVTNWTLSDKQRRIDVEVGVRYGTDPQKVIDLLMKVAAAHPEILDTPPPRALFVGFGDSSLNFQLRTWTLNIEQRFTVMSELHVEIDKAFEEAGIEIPFPQRDLHLRSVDEGVREGLKNNPPPKPRHKSESDD